MIALASDHGAYALKEKIKAHLMEKGLQVEDFGTYSPESCDYTDFVALAARAVADGRCQRGIILCTTGVGASISANKIRGVRCALCTDSFMAEMTRRHNDTNMLALGAGITGDLLSLHIVDTWLGTAFEGGRHQRRVDKIMGLEEA
ncbi:MAG: ribose 5-phosphate isomerase B [Oscillospiraceae bacterium]|nr:ribose 5-phosphate isomerase B [Oscillospiraceae bacterium]